MTERMREIVKGAAATAALVAVVVGPPLALAAAAGWPLPRELPTWSAVGDALGGSTVSDAALLKALAWACWVVWLLVVASIVEELSAWARGRASRRLPGGGALQPLVRQLVMTATLLAAVAKTTSTPAALPSVAPAVSVLEPSGQEVLPSRAAEPALPSCLVQPRDSLWKLAEDHLGDGMRWRELWDLNRDRPQVDGRVFNDPNLIHPGWQLTMPSDAVGLDPVVPETPPSAPDPLPLPPVTAPSPTTTTTTTPPTTTTEADETLHQAEPDVDASDRSADDPDFEVVPILAGAALVAAGVVASIDRLRRRQLRHRAGDRSIRLPDEAGGRVEVSLRRAADTFVYSRLDLALRNLAHQLGSADDTECPRIDVVSVGPAGIEMLLDHATDAPAGPFEVTAAGRAWTLPADVDEALLLAVARNELAPVPALATVGTVNDRSVLLDLESSPCTVLNGEPADARALLWTMAVDLATSNRADDIDLLVIGEVPHGLEALDRVRRVERISEVLSELEAQVRSTRALLAADGVETAFDARLAGRGDGMSPTVVLIDAQARPDDDLERLLDVASQQAGVAVVLTGDVAEPDRELCVEDDTLIVKPLGLRLKPGALPEAVIAAATGLVTAATEVDDGRTDSIDLRESLPSPDLALTYDAEGVPTVPEGHVLVRIFGGVEVFGGARPIDRRRCTELVVFLAFHPEGVDEERLREALWPENNPTRSAFNETVSRARRCLGLDPSGLPHVRHMARGLYQLGPYVHVEQKPAGANGLVPFQGCRGYEWAYSEGIAYALEVPVEADSQSA